MSTGAAEKSPEPMPAMYGRACSSIIDMSALGAAAQLLLPQVLNIGLLAKRVLNVMSAQPELAALYA